MNPDPRCCGSGMCIIDPDGHCWCGQRWDGEKMVPHQLPPATEAGCTPATPAADPDVAAHP